MNKKTVVVVIMGVSGSGKSTIATLVAEALNCPFRDADEFHPPANVEKMSKGTPLTDTDRKPWLEAIAAQVDAWRAAGQSGVVTCSALKKAYRDIVIDGRGGVRLVYLKGDKTLIHDRMAARKGHFMPLSLLDNQFTVMEEPGPAERPIVVDIAPSPEKIAAEVMKKLDA
jgi:gluconokinase